MRRRRRALALALLALAVLSGAAQVRAQELLTVVVTHYALRGTTYSGTQTRPGVAACSWALPIGTVVRFADGREVRCEDRGSGLGPAHVDVWVESVAEARQLGRYQTTVEIIR